MAIVYHLASSEAKDQPYVIALTGELVASVDTDKKHAPARSAAYDAIARGKPSLRLTQAYAPARLATTHCLRSLVARLSAQLRTRGWAVAIRVNNGAFWDPLAAADDAVLCSISHAQTIGAAFSVDVRMRAWSTDATALPRRAIDEAVLAVRQSATLFGAVQIPFDPESCLFDTSDGLTLGPFEAGTSAHLVIALILGIFRDATRKALGDIPATPLAALEGAREDLGNAFVDAWIAKRAR